MGKYLNIRQTGCFHIPKTHCSIIMLSLEAMYFEIKSVLNIKIIVYIKINMSVFIRKKSQVDTKKVVNQKTIKNIINV